MPFGARKTSVPNLPPRSAASKGPLGPLYLSLYLTPILMVQDIHDDIQIIVEVLAFGVVMEGGVNTMSAGDIGF